ncbi:MAG: efflux RND transporter periplasmic adaptor subunit [Porphyromonadaceae bacterium]|nr:efflux RND transporter periplasmic adaptor subunit [Porphyromonadaceae bacterium]
MKQTKKISLGLLTAILTLGLGACQGAKENKEEAQQADSTSARSVEISTVVRDTVTVTLEYSAALKAKVTNIISTQTGGRLQQLLVRVGDRVGTGQVLGKLDPFTLNQTKIQLDDAKVNYDRINELYKIGGVAKAQWEQASSAMRIAQEAYSNLLSNTILRSPTSGVVTAKNYDVGDMTAPGQPVLIVEQISPVKAEVQVSEEHYALLKQGRPATIVVDALAGETFDARISNVFPTINPATHTITVEVEAPNRKQDLRPGMYSRITLNLGNKEALLVPDMAVLRQVGSGERFVYLYQDGKAMRRVVELGALYGDRYEILSGLDAGETVITSSPSTLTNGMPVVLQTRQ